MEAVPWVLIFLMCIDTSPAPGNPAAQRVSLDLVMSGVAGVCTLPQNIKYKLFTTDNIGCGTLLVCYPRIHCIHHTADNSILLLLYCEII